MAYYPADKWLLKSGRWTVLVDKSASKLFLLLSLTLLLFVVISLSIGSAQLSFDEILSVVRGENNPTVDMILFELRLPRVVATLVAGFALGLAGCISQSIFRNRLATPDILGINEGAALAIVSFVLFTTTSAWPFWLAPIGALIAVAILYVFSARTDRGAMLLVCGVCLTEFLRAIVEFLMSMGALHEVQNIYVWLQGSFIGQGYQTSLPVFIILLISLPIQFYLGRHIDILRLSPHMATSLGINVSALRIISITTVAVLAAMGASIGGPVAFIAMGAPILVSTLLKGRTPAFWCSGLLGAGLLLFSDNLARLLANPQEIATGIVTRILGGAFLLYLLINDRTR